jgi:DNA-binding NtrC family response regulator
LLPTDSAPARGSYLPHMPPLHLLVIAADSERRLALSQPLRTAGMAVFDTGDPAVGAESLAVPGFDAALVDLSLPSMDVSALRAAIAPGIPAPPDSLADAERRHIARTLRHTGGNRRHAALILGISRSTLLHKIRKYRLESGGG